MDLAVQENKININSSEVKINKIIFYIKKKEFLIFSSEFNQIIFDKNYNRIIQSLNNVDFKSVSSVDIKGNNLHMQLICDDGLILDHIVELTKC